jgi:hypothetical protein
MNLQELFFREVRGGLYLSISWQRMNIKMERKNQNVKLPTTSAYAIAFLDT